MAFRHFSIRSSVSLVVLLSLAVVGAAVWLAAHSSLSRKPAVPAQLRGKAEVVGFSGIRYTLEEESLVLLDVIESEIGIEGLESNRAIFVRGGNTKYQPINLLALSSGADGGAFGAGFLNG
jgi:hypothetical protein